VIDSSSVPIPEGFVVMPETPFYRVAAKVLVKDEQDRLLVTQNERGKWELPGGGLEHHESVEQCVSRELQEEAGVDVKVGKFRFMFRGLSERRKYMAMRLVFDGTLVESTPSFSPGDDMVEVRFVSRQEFLELTFAKPDAPIQEYVDVIWSEK
jgi:8-oxo-dGTP pyrophosphatase MutT (NUDIX family)